LGKPTIRRTLLALGKYIVIGMYSQIILQRSQ
jgi:hypothetical protein